MNEILPTKYLLQLTNVMIVAVNFVLSLFAIQELISYSIPIRILVVFVPVRFSLTFSCGLHFNRNVCNKHNAKRGDE